jgi:GNAT superfamily N-acetyltransferase
LRSDAADKRYSLGNMNIRSATPQDAGDISTLILGVAHYFTLNPDGVGAEDFLKTISRDSIEGYINAPNINYLAGFIDDTLVGVVAIRDNKHLHHLFVSPLFQRRGISRKLWNHAVEMAIQLGNPGEFTVNSTPYAAPVYASFGFEAVGRKIETSGIAFIPMKLSLGGLVA